MVHDPAFAARVMELAGPQSPGEAITLIKRRWPETWARLCDVAWQRQQAPGALMVALIESGLSAEEL
jgi:hypothetical protein